MRIPDCCILSFHMLPLFSLWAHRKYCLFEINRGCAFVLHGQDREGKEKRIASPGSMHDTGRLGLVHWDDPEGWNGEGGGRRVQDGEHMYTCGGFILIFGKTNTIM